MEPDYGRDLTDCVGSWETWPSKFGAGGAILIGVVAIVIDADSGLGRGRPSRWGPVRSGMYRSTSPTTTQRNWVGSSTGTLWAIRGSESAGSAPIGAATSDQAHCSGPSKCQTPRKTKKPCTAAECCQMTMVAASSSNRLHLTPAGTTHIECGKNASSGGHEMAIVRMNVPHADKDALSSAQPLPIPQSYLNMPKKRTIYSVHLAPRLYSSRGMFSTTTSCKQRSAAVPLPSYYNFVRSERTSG